ncbi:hypothetical protein CNEO4_760003 [Clostridium neonatale]|uniref:Uncharacterized protein n=1 Tax=Clostridium neonatale TaxID=137838 RepID=A0AA86JFQ3_9CLOT|nr:hypothetical protein CNEO_41570 [Clostridium neonatale]CAG9718313.1 hypothetical protein CNEO_690045 [Clostridium neonatale]CAI3197593.1 hypothetical protein CNEO2_10080 [Clostridium neonatale]CAI3198647.1 hypothetical protein CNEO2_190002 [Clostridium neonatale]CAI3201441.1 hypothetical protein CNEO2_10132 [Clostridium neonatale]
MHYKNFNIYQFISYKLVRTLTHDKNYLIQQINNINLGGEKC